MERQQRSVPTFDEIVTRNSIEILKSHGDLTVRNGDIAVTRWGDLMLNDADYSAFFKLVHAWRFNLSTLETLFIASVDGEAHRAFLDERLDEVVRFQSTERVVVSPDLDAEAFHKANDQLAAAGMASGVYAGTVAVVLHRMLLGFHKNISGKPEEWKKSGTMFYGFSFGQILEASANNFRHLEEWQVLREIKGQPLHSLKILAALLQEPLDVTKPVPLRLRQDVSAETLSLLSGGVFEVLEFRFYEFAKALLDMRQLREPSR